MTKYRGISKDGFVDSNSIVSARKKIIQWAKKVDKDRVVVGTQMIYKMPDYKKFGRVIFRHGNSWFFTWEKCDENGDEVADYVLNENGTLRRLIRKYRR